MRALTADQGLGGCAAVRRCRAADIKASPGGTRTASAAPASACRASAERAKDQDRCGDDPRRQEIYNAVTKDRSQQFLDSGRRQQCDHQQLERPDPAGGRQDQARQRRDQERGQEIRRWNTGPEGQEQPQRSPRRRQIDAGEGQYPYDDRNAWHHAPDPGCRIVGRNGARDDQRRAQGHHGKRSPGQWGRQRQVRYHQGGRHDGRHRGDERQRNRRRQAHRRAGADARQHPPARQRPDQRPEAQKLSQGDGHPSGAHGRCRRRPGAQVPVHRQVVLADRPVADCCPASAADQCQTPKPVIASRMRAQSIPSRCRSRSTSG